MPFKWLRHAFAVDPPGAKAPTKQQEEIVESVCTEITRRHLTTPALLFLEMFRPLNYLGSQVLHFFHPIATAVLDGDGYRRFAEFLEQRGSIDYLCGRIEALEDDYKKSGKE
jgi:hypothetical protein